MINDSAVVFAFLAIFFALVNLILWVCVIRLLRKILSEAQVSRASVPRVTTPADDDAKTEKLFDEVLRIEDQLWGVLDKLRDIKSGEERLGKIENMLSGINESIKENDR